MSFKGSKYIVLSVVVGLVAVIAIHRGLSLRNNGAAEASTQVLVAEADITSGTALSARLVKPVTFPQRLVPPQAIQSVDQVNGRVLAMPLSRGEPVLLTKLAPEGTAAGLGGLLQETMRAFTVKVDDVSGVAGFINPGDRVDVLVSLPVLNSRGEQLSKVILQDLKVLTAGQVWQPNAKNEPKSINTVTLEVSPEQSEVLNLATTQGKIRLTLRSRVNKEIKETPGVITSYLVNGASHQVAKTDSEPVKSKEKERTVEVIRGMDRTSAKL